MVVDDPTLVSSHDLPIDDETADKNPKEQQQQKAKT